MKRLQEMIVTQIEDVAEIYSPKGRFVAMKDRESYGLSFCAEGQITYTHKGNIFVSDAAHVVFLPKGKSYTVRGDKTGTFQLINFDAQNFCLETFLCLPMENAGELILDFAALQKLFFAENARPKVFSIFYDMLHKISFTASDKKGILDPLAEYIRQNIGDPALCNQMMANHLGISEVYFRKRFSEEYGTTPHQYLLDQRIDMAKRMMRSSDKNITEIAFACGFSSVYHFSRAFKAKTGLTPGTYMQKNRWIGI